MKVQGIHRQTTLNVQLQRSEMCMESMCVNENRVGLSVFPSSGIKVRSLSHTALAVIVTHQQDAQRDFPPPLHGHGMLSSPLLWLAGSFWSPEQPIAVSHQGHGKSPSELHQESWNRLLSFSKKISLTRHWNIDDQSSKFILIRDSKFVKITDKYLFKNIFKFIGQRTSCHFGLFLVEENDILLIFKLKTSSSLFTFFFFPNFNIHTSSLSSFSGKCQLIEDREGQVFTDLFLSDLYVRYFLVPGWSADTTGESSFFSEESLQTYPQRHGNQWMDGWTELSISVFLLTFLPLSRWTFSWLSLETV